MDLIWFSTILLVGFAAWLWHLSRGISLPLEIEYLSSKVKFKSLRLRERRFFVLLVIPMPFFVGIICFIYFLIISKFWIALLLVVAGLIMSVILAFLIIGGANAPPWYKLGYFGKADLPKRVYEGDSKNIFIELSPILGEPCAGEFFEIELLQDTAQDHFLEIELLAAGVKVDGDKKQRQMLKDTFSEFFSFKWNLFFANSGNHSIAFIIRLVNSSDVVEVGTIQHSIKVVKLLNLTQRQIWILATIAGMLSGILAIGQSLHKLGFW